jgi:MFS family permease
MDGWRTLKVTAPAPIETRRRDRRPPALAALAYRDYRLLWSGLLVSSVGDWMQTFALGWYLVQLAIREGTPDRAALYIGLVGVSRVVPFLVVGLVAGTLSDRVDRRRLLIAGQASAGAVALLLAVLAASDLLSVPVLMAATGVFGVIAAFDAPARQGMVPALVPPRALASAVGLLQSVMNLATVIGPLIGGVLIGVVGVPGILFGNALSFPLAIGVLVLMRPATAAARGPALPVWQAMREGFGFVWREPIIRPLFLVLIVVSLLARPIPQLLPAVAANRLHVGPVELSWLLGAAGVGALVGAFLSASIGGLHRRGLLAVGFAIATGVLLLTFALQDSVIPAIVLVGALSLTIQAHVTNHVTVYQTRTPDALRGRVIGVSSTLAQSSIAFGTFLLGSIGSLVGIEVALAVAGGVVVLASLGVVLRFPLLRREPDVGLPRLDQLDIVAQPLRNDQ